MDDAHYHCHVDWISRSEGRDAVAAAAYRAGEQLANPNARSGFSDFRHKQDRTLHTQIFAPPAAPAWVHDRALLWQAVEASEKRSDARLATEVRFAIPYPIKEKQREALIADMAAPYVARGAVVDAALHVGEDGKNPHVHMMITTRAIGPNGFASTKLPGYDKVSAIHAARKLWETVGNKALAAAGSALRLDRRSYAERGDRKRPGRHRGPDRDERARKRAEGTRNRVGHEEGMRMGEDRQTPAGDRSLYPSLRGDWPPRTWQHDRDDPQVRAELRGYMDAVREPELSRDAIAERIAAYAREERVERVGPDNDALVRQTLAGRERAAASERDERDPRTSRQEARTERPEPGADRESLRDRADRLVRAFLPAPERPEPEPYNRNRQVERFERDNREFMREYFPEQYREMVRDERDEAREQRARDRFNQEAEARSRVMNEEREAQIQQDRSDRYEARRAREAEAERLARQERLERDDRDTR